MRGLIKINLSQLQSPIYQQGGRAIWALKEITFGKDCLHFQENAALSLESLYCIGYVCQMQGWMHSQTNTVREKTGLHRRKDQRNGTEI